MKQLLLWLIVAVVLIGGGIGASMALTASRQQPLTDEQKRAKRKALVEKAREHGRHAWAREHPKYPDARCLYQEPLIRPDGDRIFVRFSWSQYRNGDQHLERIEMYLDEEGALQGEVNCVLKKEYAETDTGDYL